MTTRTAVLYARVSTAEQAEQGYSLAQQIEACRTWCERKGYEVLEEVSDPGQSGATLQRRGMNRVRDLVAAGGVSVVVAQERDRFPGNRRTCTSSARNSGSTARGSWPSMPAATGARRAI